MATETPTNCEVCNEAMEADHNANCAFCGRIFHLTWDTRKPIRDCGKFDIDNETLALYFTCNTCMSGQQPQAQAGTA